MLSLIIPTLKTPPDFFERLLVLRPLVNEVILASADLKDEGILKAKQLDVMVINCEKGRGHQLAAGAKAAKGDWLLFLHADTFLEDGWRKEIDQFMREAPLKAAYFQFRLDEENEQSRWLAKTVAWRCEKFGLPYGDQGLLISKEHYLKIGGYPKIPLMEDVSIVRQIGKAHLHGLNAAAITSAEKYQKGYKLRSARNLFCLFLFFIGVSPKVIKKVYG